MTIMTHKNILSDFSFKIQKYFWTFAPKTGHSLSTPVNFVSSAFFLSPILRVSSDKFIMRKLHSQEFYLTYKCTDKLIDPAVKPEKLVSCSRYVK